MAYEYQFAQLEYLGLFDVILPFILVFTIVFAVLQKVKLFGSDSKRFNSVIALVMGLGVVFPHVMGYYPPERDIVTIINTSLPNVSVVVVAVVMALLVLGVFGGKWELAGNSVSGWLALLSFGLVVYIFGAAANWWNTPAWLYMLENPDTVALIITILVFAIIIWFITKEDKGNEPGPFGKFMKDLGDNVKKS